MYFQSDSSIQEYAWKNIYPQITPSSIFDGKRKLKIAKIAILRVTKENRHRPMYLAKNSDYLFYLSMRHTFTYTAKDNKCSWLQGWVILECKPVKKEYTILNKYTTNRLYNKKLRILSVLHRQAGVIFWDLWHTFELVQSTGPATCTLEYPSYKPKKNYIVWIHVTLRKSIFKIQNMQLV